MNKATVGNKTKFVYTSAEQPIIDQLKVIMPQTATSTIDEGRLWCELRTGAKEVEGRFDVLCESLGTTRDHAYYCIKVYEASLPTVELPAMVKGYLEATGLNLTMPENPTADQKKEVTANQKAARRAFQKAGITGEPTRKNLAAINKQAISYLEVEEPTEEKQLIDSFNALFTDSYRRIVGTPKFGKKEKGQSERPFLGSFPVGCDTKNDAKLMPDGSVELRKAEVEWTWVIQKTLRNVAELFKFVGEGGPDLIWVGRGADPLIVTDFKTNTGQEVAA